MKDEPRAEPLELRLGRDLTAEEIIELVAALRELEAE